MSKPIDYRNALEDCLSVMRAGGDLNAAVARYPQHADALRDDVRIAYALRRAAAALPVPPGAEARASIHLANALREARAEAQPARKAGPFSWFTGALRPIAIAGVAVVALVVFGLGATGNVSNPIGGPSSAEASTVEGVVVENRDGTLTLETAQGLATIDLNQRPTIQDDTARLLSVADIEAGQVVRIEAKKTPQGALIARQVDRKAVNALQDWCAEHGDTCRQVQPRLEQDSTQCRPNDLGCQRLQQSVKDLQTGLQELTKRIQDLKNRCERADGPGCRMLMQACKDHPVICQELKVRPITGGPGQAAPGQPRDGQRVAPQQPVPQQAAPQQVAPQQPVPQPQRPQGQPQMQPPRPNTPPRS